MRQQLYDYLPLWAQNVACSFAGWQRSQRRYTRHFHEVLQDFEHTLFAPPEELRALQALRLAEMLEHARAHVPHYRELPPIARHRDPGEAIARTLAQIEPLEKSTYRDHPERFVASDYPRWRLVRGKTSGTTGTALTLWYAPDAVAEEYATVWRLRRRLGLDLRDPHLTFGGQMVVPFHADEPPFWRWDHYTHQVLFSPYHMKRENLPAYVDAVHASEARYAAGYPSSLHLVARALLDAGRPLPKGRLRAVFTSSESLLAFQREAIEAGFGAPLYDRYGASEFAVSMTACELRHLHVDMEYCIVEVEPVEESAEWVRGPLLVTGLGNRATPFIRYRIGDIGTQLRGPCPCGRPGDVFLDIDGRIEDYVMTPDGRLVGRLDHIFKEQRDVAEAQILQDDKESLRIAVVPQPTWNEASEASLLAQVRARLGPDIRVEIVKTDQIPREPNGKLRAVKSRVGRGFV
jgi:phenylacetate-CoA ligase